MFRDYVKKLAQDEAIKVFNDRIKFLDKSNNSNTGECEITKVNSDNTVDVKINGQVVKNVSPGSRPGLGVGSRAVLVDGKTLVR